MNILNNVEFVFSFLSYELFTDTLKVRVNVTNDSQFCYTLDVDLSADDQEYSAITSLFDRFEECIAREVRKIAQEFCCEHDDVAEIVDSVKRVSALNLVEYQAL